MPESNGNIGTSSLEEEKEFQIRVRQWAFWKQAEIELKKNSGEVEQILD